MPIKSSSLRLILISVFAISMFMVHRLIFQNKGIFAAQFDHISAGSGAAISFSALAGICLVVLLIVNPKQSEDSKP